jgi:hypothetical protein
MFSNQLSVQQKGARILQPKHTSVASKYASERWRGGQWPVVSGQWPVGQWSVVSGQWSVIGAVDKPRGSGENSADYCPIQTYSEQYGKIPHAQNLEGKKQMRRQINDKARRLL